MMMMMMMMMKLKNFLASGKLHIDTWGRQLFSILIRRSVPGTHRHLHTIF